MLACIEKCSYFYKKYVLENYKTLFCVILENIFMTYEKMFLNKTLNRKKEKKKKTF